MNTAELLLDGFGRVHDSVHAAVAGLDVPGLTHRVDPDTNTIAWLVWHLTRVQDDHICDVAGTEQEWTAGGWADRFGLPFDKAATGYGHTSADVAAVQCSATELLGYHDAVHARTSTFLRALTDADLDRVVDEQWDPPVTLGVRLVSVLDDDLEHAGQAALLRGIVERAGF
ncbi:mycothiol transferase [Pseudonocardia sp. CA-107938]|uniref:mycothiol transferase n=1 Tax=Pseudonocardia sp. CA-107938 TaxID=3240021 RepID=UPI003D8B6337